MKQKFCSHAPENKNILFGVLVVPERSTVKGGRQGHDGVSHRQQAEEEDQQQQSHVKIVRLGCFEDSCMRDIAAHNSPALKIHGG